MKKISVLMPIMAIYFLISVGCGKDGKEGTIKDHEENKYKTIAINDQIWMAENLRTATYPAGEQIDGMMVYDKDNENIETYGRLYTFEAATRNEEPDKKGRIRGVCPKGWHIPSDQEWKALEKFLGVNDNDLDLLAWRGTIEGGMLKATGTEHWEAPNKEATNSVGFNALPGGSFNPGLGFNSKGMAAYFWASTENSATESWTRVLQYTNGQIGRYSSSKNLAASVRCVKN